MRSEPEQLTDSPAHITPPHDGEEKSYGEAQASQFCDWFEDLTKGWDEYTDSEKQRLQLFKP